MLPSMSRSRTTTSPFTRRIAGTAMVVAALGIGWCFEPSGIRADQDRGPSIIVREPADVRPGTTQDDALESIPATHAIIVDSDLDLDLDFATDCRP